MKHEIDLNDFLIELSLENDHYTVNSIEHKESKSNLIAGHEKKFTPELTSDLIDELILSRVKSEIIIRDLETKQAELEEDLDNLYEKLKLAETFIEENRGKLE